MVLPAPVSVEVATLARVVRRAGLGELHVVLEPAAAWRPRVAEQVADDVAWEACARLSWLDRRGELDVEVTAALRVLCQAGVEFYGWIDDGERTRGVLCAAIGRKAMLVVRDGNSVWLSRTREATLAEVLAAQTPDVRAGRGQAFRAPRAEVAATSPKDGRAITATGTGRLLASPEARQIRRLAELPTMGGGELRVAVRDHLGRRRVAPQALHYVDTVQGRYLALSEVAGGEQYVLVIPATRADLATRLREQRRRLTGVTAPSR
jgi:hypothetical protein